MGGGHHHHDHHHLEIAPDDKKVGWFGLVILGVSGGIVPCWDAILMLGFAISAHRVWLALPLLLAFSAGLAGVLVAIGLGVVYLKGYADSRMSESRHDPAAAARQRRSGYAHGARSLLREHSRQPARAPAAEHRVSGV